ncbi:ammonia-forming cytochrome c nitrite reductase subunit c552, partial [Escherichia coli]|nr:ammonia-forming cytochrome c nitrite reductase subunit c552 [Escherichia coli]
MSVLRSLLTAGVLASGLLWSLNGITATPAAQASGDRYEVTQQRNPDAACLDCHKPDIEGMHGKHASVINPNNKLPVTCTNCHGQPSPQHREGVKDVMRFNEPMYKVGEQNSVC